MTISDFDVQTIIVEDAFEIPVEVIVIEVPGVSGATSSAELAVGPFTQLLDGAVTLADALALIDAMSGFDGGSP